MAFHLPDLQSLRPWRARGLEELSKRVGDITQEIEARLGRQERVRVLEVGFGFGTVLMELLKKYPGRLELHGINRRRAHGNWEAVRQNALSLGLFGADELDRLKPPDLHYCDVSEGVPFEEGTVDLVYSQVAVIYFDDKIRFLEELNRVLAPGGVARIDLWIERKDFPSEYGASLEIWDEGRKVPFWDYIKPFASLAARPGKKRSYLELRKAGALDFGLDLAHVINMNDLCREWWGRKSIYRVRRG